MDCLEQLVGLRLRFGFVAGGEGAGDAMIDVLVEDLEAEALERGGDGADLGEDVDAVAVVGDHALDSAHLPLDPVQALDQRVLLAVVAVVVNGLLVGRGAHATPSLLLRKRRSRKLFVTTKMLEAAIAAAAMIGLSRPATASGIAATL